MDSNKIKKLLVLGGKPIASLDIVNYAKSKGIYTIVADYLAKDSSLAKKTANETWEYSTAETDFLSSKMEKENIDAVFTGVHEFNIQRTLDICEELNLPFYTTRRQWDILSDKHKYKQLFANYGLPKIKEFYAGKIDNLQIEKIEYPVIVKPTDGSSGFGVKICKSQEELSENLLLASEKSHSSNVLIEEYVSSPEVTIFYIIKDGKIMLSAMADRLTYKFEDEIIPLPTLYTFPSSHLPYYEAKYNQNVIDAFNSVGVKNGMIFMQAFWRNNECLIYDIGFRLTGTQEYNLLSKICGYNPLEMLVDYSLTGKMGQVDIENKVDPYFKGMQASIITILVNPGKISQIEGIESIEKIPFVDKFILNHEIGEEIPQTAKGTLVQIMARAFVICETKEQIETTEMTVRKLFKVKDEFGKDMIIK